MTEYEARQKAIDRCDDETPFRCYCGRLATGLHTNNYRKFQAKVARYTKEILKEEAEQKNGKKIT